MNLAYKKFPLKGIWLTASCLDSYTVQNDISLKDS